MASTLSENGDAAEEFSQPSEADDLKMNGEVNGTTDCEEPMDVDDSPVKHVKNPSSSDVNNLSDMDNNCDSDPNKETNSVSENCITSPKAAVNSQVPEQEEEASSNGFQDHEGKDEAEKSNNENQQVQMNDSVEDDDDAVEQHTNKEDSSEKEEKGKEEGKNKEEKEEVEEEDEDVVLMEDDVADPLETDTNPLEEEDSLEQDKPASNNECIDLDDSIGPEHEESDPLVTDNDQNNTLKTKNKGELVHDKKEDMVLDKTNAESDSTNENETTHSPEENQEDCDLKEKDETDKIEKMEIEDDENKNDSPEKSKMEDENEKTPDGKAKKKKTPQQPINITPRRSSRNVQKPKLYVDEPDIKAISPPAKKVADDPDIEEIVPQDPLAMDSPISEKKNKKTVVVSDPKRLVEIATGSKQSKPGKKEPTLVIIDTNSILSGRGPVPVTPTSSLTQTSMAGSSRTQAYSVLPMALPAQGMYPQAIPRQPHLKSIVMSQSSSPSPPIAPKPPVILPSLTDDMYVVEAPSFIVPYVYEKPPIKPLKGFVEQVEQAIKEIKAQLEKEKEKEKEDKKNEELEKISDEKEEVKDIKEEKKDIKEEKKDTKEDNKEDKSDLKEGKSDIKVGETEEKDEKEKKSDEKDKEEDKNKDKAETSEVTTKTESEKEVKPNDVKEEKMDIDLETPKDAKDEITSSVKEKVETKEAEKSTSTKTIDSKPAESEKSDKPSDEGKSEESEKKKSSSYFDNPLGKFFIQIGVNLVQEHVQTDLLRSQKRKKERDGSKCTPEVQQAMNSLIRSLEFSRETNEPFKLELKKCEYCSFKTESALVMAHHLETPHMRNYVYRCNFCPLEVRSPHDILYHMEAEHNVRGRLERAPAFHQCPSCPFEDNQKGKLSRHLLSCAKKYRPERNQEPPLDFEPPAKIPRVSRNRPAMSPGTAVYQAAMSGLKNPSPHPLLPKLVPTPSPPGLIRGRGRPQMMNRYLGDMRATSALAAQQKALAQMRPGMLYRPSGSNAQPQVLLPTSYQLAGSQLYQDQMSLYQQMVANHNRGLISASSHTLPSQNAAAVAAAASAASKASASQSPTAKLLQQPSISITPLPRPTPPAPAPNAVPPVNKPGRPAGTSKATFVICEICDGYIKDLEQLRNHMQWIHKVKIHPKMIYNRPPLNCQKCQFRFFTDQGLERHLLGSHGLVTSSMQEAANKGKDGGRCPVCGRVYQWKLLNHVARDHNMSLKPAHLSYKCTVCTATFGMYKQFENHVYSAHSVVAKRVMDKKPSTSAQASTSSQGDMLKPLKINDEITIIPQPARAKTKPAGPNRNPQKKV